ncbi:MAG: hypothetical protein II996_02995 [Oscillospiraceae bacterium]|nr:hypothetical protein [Oscillospiraceae bacterium]
MNNDTLQAKALVKLIKLYGMDYMKSKICSAWVVRCDMGDYMRFSFCFELGDERPDLQADYKGWAVWATLDVDRETGEVKVIECVLPDGSRVTE